MNPSTGRVGVGVVGPGMISDAYLENLTRFPDLDVVIVGGRTPSRARTRAERHGVGRWGTTEDVLGHPDVEVVVNLTVPAAHAPLTAQALAAGKHVWSEKPVSLDPATARALLDQADRAGLLLGVAPDTVLGPGVQTARRVIAAGGIGVPLSARTVLQYAGPDLFHPNPAFLFAPGAGPVFDIGPYYLTTLVLLLGPVARVSAVGSTARATRTVQVGELAGTTFPVGVPTHVGALLEFAGGGVAESTFSFDSPLTRTGIVEITGTEGTLVVPDPNEFTGDLALTRAPTTHAQVQEGPVWETVPSRGAVAGRGIGVLDLARAARSGASPRASGRLASHVLDVMTAIEESVRTHQSVEISSRPDEVPLVPEGWDPHRATL